MSDLRERLGELLEPLVRDLVDELVREKIAGLVQGLVGGASASATPSPRTSSSRPLAKPARIAAITKAASKGVSKGHGTPHCKACGQAGHTSRSRSCPAKAKAGKGKPDDEDEGARAAPTPQQGGGESPLFAELVQAGRVARAERTAVAAPVDAGADRAGPPRGAERADVDVGQPQARADEPAPAPVRPDGLTELAKMRNALRRETGSQAIRQRLPTFHARPRTMVSGRGGSGASLRLSDEEKAFEWTAADRDALAERPRTRGDCVAGERPCPWMGCRHHLGLDVAWNGAVKLTFPDRELEQLPETCALDVADRGGNAVHADFAGGATLEQIAVAMNLTRERVRQIETKAYAAMNAALHAKRIRPEHIDDLEAAHPQQGMEPR